MKPTKRREDQRLLTGHGRFLADHVSAATHHAGFLRADQASATVARLDVGPARDLPGVVGIFTAQDLAADGVGPIGHAQMPREDGGEPGRFPQPVLSGDIVRHAGESLAIVVATSPAAVADAIEAIEVDLQAAPPISGIAFHRNFGDAHRARAEMDRARHRQRVTLDAPRVTAMALEPRCAIATPGSKGRLTYRASTQNPFALRGQICDLLGWETEALRVMADDVGGSFGLKGYMTREDAALAWAARRLGVEIAWLPSRSETLLSDAQGRGITGEIEIGLDDDLNIVALTAHFDVDAGAYPDRRAFGLMGNMNGITGVYRIGAVAAQVTGHLSPHGPLVPFRGNGRPEATYAIERALDLAARQIGADPVDLRRRNLIPPTAMPAETTLGVRIDCGDFPQVMQAALVLNGPPDERWRAAEADGRLFGFGLANCIESAGGPIRKPRPDHARVTVSGDGSVGLAPGVMSVGQGHETVLTTMAAERLQIDPERIIYRHGDTQAVSNGRGSGGSAGLTVAGSALWQALTALQDAGAQKASSLLECGADEISFRDGAFNRTNSNESVSLADIAASMGGMWQVEASFTPAAATFPNGCHICEVVIDPQTGAVQVTRYTAVEDVGRILSPALVEGQLHGGIAQGLSIGLGERIVFDEAGQLLTGTLMDYQVAKAPDVPFMQIGAVEVPTKLNPLGVKGVGEAGTVGATAAIASAVGDALHRAGVAGFEMPATPARVWRALQDVMPR